MRFIDTELSGYYFAFGHFFIIADHPDSAKRIAEHPELQVISQKDLESPQAEELLNTGVKAK
jgi:hypothetical protein